jgi:hypothetical protein
MRVHLSARRFMSTKRASQARCRFIAGIGRADFKTCALAFGSEGPPQVRSVNLGLELPSAGAACAAHKAVAVGANRYRKAHGLRIVA